MMLIPNLSDRANACGNQEALLALGVEQAQRLGFDFFTLGYKHMSSFSAPEVQFISNYPMAWLQEYASSGYIATDPTLLKAAKTSKPVVWSTQFFENTPALWAAANSHGINHGCALATSNALGDMGLLVLARRVGDITTKELTTITSFMTATAHILFERILFLTGHGSEHVEENRRSKLSGREVEILRYTADGKTSQDISQLLDISERTVAFHINNILLKFSVPNKTAAVARAVVQGLI